MKEFIEKLIGRLEENIFVAELHGFGWEGQRVCNLLCLGDVKDIAEELAEEHEDCFILCSNHCETYDKEKHYCPKWCNTIKNTVKEMVENESGVILMQLLEAKKNCGEDSNCSECPFGQIEDRCILAELQMPGRNNGYCEWEYDEFETKWQTDCGVLFALHDSDREITKFCSCCGKKIKVVEPKEGDI